MQVSWNSITDKIHKVKYMGKNVNVCAKVAVNTWPNYSESNTCMGKLYSYSYMAKDHACINSRVYSYNNM